MALGVPRQAAEEAVKAQWDGAERRDDGPRAFAVLPENWDAVRLFLKLRNRWQVHAFSGRRVGLVAADVQATMEMMGVRRKRRGRLLEQIEVLEDAALAQWARTNGA